MKKYKEIKANCGPNCKKLKSKDRCVKGTAMQGLITIWSRAPIAKCNIEDQIEKQPPSR